MRYDYEDEYIGYALKRVGIGMGFDVYADTEFGYRKVGFICIASRPKAIKILKEIFYYDNKYSKNKSKGQD